ncbi:hypothetical protein DdX_19005 [Ditylenchus destructor]|uniref:Uncharacterized protein n=1 Tax=Ditylenchus destructor TaxID=166010 RepID=A0AAD4QXS1_9BILA|nr:hypothetical protein DdX_19005 [Ditylenchus destructor]
MELNTLFLEEIRDQLSLGHIQKFKVHKVSLSDQHEESNSKDSTSCTGDIESVRQINTIDFAGNAMHCELVDRRIRRTMRSRSNKLR